MARRKRSHPVVRVPAGFDMGQAAWRAVEGECARGMGQGYRWRERDCISLIQALCSEAGLAVPDYGCYRKHASELKAGLAALGALGSFGLVHQSELLATGGWERVVEGGPRDGDVLSASGRVDFASGFYEPPREGMELTGIVAAGRWWTWQPLGLAGVDPARVTASHLTRAA